MQCGRPGKTLALLTTPQPPSVPSSGRPSATTSRRWTRTQPSGCAGAIPRSWSSTPPASSCGPTPPPRASTPPTHTPSSSGCTGCSSWPSTTRLMVRLHRHRFEYIWEVMEGLKSWIFIFPVCVSLLSQGTFLYLHPVQAGSYHNSLVLESSDLRVQELCANAPGPLIIQKCLDSNTSIFIFILLLKVDFFFSPSSCDGYPFLIISSIRRQWTIFHLEVLPWTLV